MNQSAEAKIWADKYIKKHKKKIKLLISGKSGLVYCTELLIEEYGALNNQGYYEIDGLAALFLLKRAEVDLFAFYAIRKMISQNILKNKKIPMCWRELHASLVTGIYEKLLKHKRYETKDWRNFIAQLVTVTLMEKYQLPFYTNLASKRGTSSVEITNKIMNSNKLIPITEDSALALGIRRLIEKSPIV